MTSPTGSPPLTRTAAASPPPMYSSGRPPSRSAPPAPAASLTQTPEERRRAKDLEAAVTAAAASKAAPSGSIGANMLEGVAARKRREAKAAFLGPQIDLGGRGCCGRKSTHGGPPAYDEIHAPSKNNTSKIVLSILLTLSVALVVIGALGLASRTIQPPRTEIMFKIKVATIMAGQSLGAHALFLPIFLTTLGAVGAIGSAIGLYRGRQVTVELEG